MHPILLFDESDAQQVERASAAARELLEECIECGGSVTAEHGIGAQKLALMERLYSEEDLTAMARVRRAFDPTGRWHPAKVLPDERG